MGGHGTSNGPLKGKNLWLAQAKSITLHALTDKIARGELSLLPSGGENAQWDQGKTIWILLHGFDSLRIDPGGDRGTGSEGGTITGGRPLSTEKEIARTIGQVLDE